MGYKRRYRDLLESEKYRIRRNEQLFAALKRLEMRISFLSATTEKYKALRSKYQVFSNKIQRGRVNLHNPTNEPSVYQNFTENIPNPNTVLFTSTVNNSRNQQSGISEPRGYYGMPRDREELFLRSPRQTYQKTFLDQSIPLSQLHPVQNTSSLNYQDNPRIIIDQIKSKHEEYPGFSNENQINETLANSKSYMKGIDTFRRDETVYSDDIRHQTANNSKDLYLGGPKYESVDRSTSDINTDAIGGPIHQKSEIVAPVYNEDVVSDNNLRMPEEVLKKYQQVRNTHISTLDLNASEKPLNPIGKNIPTVLDNQMNEMPAQNENNFSTNVRVEENSKDSQQEKTPPMYKNIVRNIETAAYTPVSNTVENLATIQNKLEIIEADKVVIIQNVNETDEPHKSFSTKPIESVEIPEIKNSIKFNEIEDNSLQNSLEKTSELLENGMINDVQENNSPLINEATEEIIGDLECVIDLQQPSIGTISPGEQHEVENTGAVEILHNSKADHNIDVVEDNTGLNCKKEDLGHEDISEKLSEMKLQDEVERVEQPQYEAEEEQNYLDEPIKVENFSKPNDQDVAEVCQDKTSEDIISNDNQNSQQETQQLNSNPEDHENSEVLEMKKFKKRNSNTQPQPQPQQQYDQQNYPVDGQGQPYDMSGQPISYDHGMPSGTQDPSYGQGYVYNEKGELVMPYDQTGQPYDQQYYQNDPNYANYDQYAQQYDDQQQYGEYDQEGYDPAQQGNYDGSAQQGNYDGSAQQGYDPNHYNAYYAEVKYDQDPFYQGATQDPVQNPQHQENEEPDKTNKLVHMLESDTENSSRQEHKVTTESDFDFSNN